MKNKIMKFLSILILLIVFSALVLSNLSFASYVPDFNSVTDSSYAGNTANVIYTVFGAIVNILTIIGAGIALIILIWMGVQYMISSVEKKADIKKQSHSYILGACILFGASAILKLVYTFIENSINKAV